MFEARWSTYPSLRTAPYLSFRSICWLFGHRSAQRGIARVHHCWVRR
jgi:hypothetical protein